MACIDRVLRPEVCVDEVTFLFLTVSRLHFLQRFHRAFYVNCDHYATIGIRRVKATFGLGSRAVEMVVFSPLLSC